MRILFLLFAFLGILYLILNQFRQKTTVQPALAAQIPAALHIEAPKVRGLTMVAPPEPFETDPMPHALEVGANWIAVVPYAFTMPGKPKVTYNVRGMQWWGEKPEGAKETIRLAKEKGIQVMLKPQVYIPGSWTGLLDFESAEDWESWEKEYSVYILEMAAMAEASGVALFCIGTEFRTSIAKRPEYWTALIDRIRQVYKGKLTYSANWDDWDKVPFYDRLDYIGMSAYYPLHDAPTPDLDTLVQAWQPIMAKMEAFQQEIGKPVLFTEYGYLSVDGCAGRNWELEQKIDQLAINQEAQARAYLALFKAFSGKTWWHGGFLWKWFPNMRGHEGYPEKDYTPQGKLGEEALKKCFGKK